MGCRRTANLTGKTRRIPTTPSPPHRPFGRPPAHPPLSVLTRLSHSGKAVHRGAPLRTSATVRLSKTTSTLSASRAESRPARSATTTYAPRSPGCRTRGHAWRARGGRRSGRTTRFPGPLRSNKRVQQGSSHRPTTTGGKRRRLPTVGGTAPGPPERRTHPRTDPARHHSRLVSSRLGSALLVTATRSSGPSDRRRAQTDWQRPLRRKQLPSAGSPRRRRASRPRRCPGDRTDEAPGSPHVGPATP